MYPCPTCGARLSRHASRCNRCGELLQEEIQVVEEVEEDDRPWDDDRVYYGGRRDAEPHRGTFILLLGIGSLALFWIGIVGVPLGVAALVMGRGDTRKMRARDMDREGEGLTQAGIVCGIVGIVLGSLCTVGALLYFGLMFTLVQNIRRIAPVRPPPGGPPAAPTFKKGRAEFVPQALKDYLPRNC